MNFREYVAARAATDLLAEADLLGVPSSGSSTEAPKKPSPPQAGEDHQTSTGPSSSTDSPPEERVRRATTLAGKLVRLLGALPPPLNKQFHAFLHPLRELLGRLQDIS